MPRNKNKKSGTNPGSAPAAAAGTARPQDDAPPAYASTSTPTAAGDSAPSSTTETGASTPIQATLTPAPTPADPATPSLERPNAVLDISQVDAKTAGIQKEKGEQDDKDDNSAPATTKGPTIDAPFDFPSDSPPSYAASSSSQQQATTRPIAIPQTAPTPSSTFLLAHSPALLARGIAADSWHAFLQTLSAFLSASVSDRALAHAADVGRKVGDHPTGFAKRLTSHVQRVGKGIADDARSGNVIGAAFKIIGGAISIPMHAAVGTAATAVSMPGVAVSAAVSKPQTPRGRAAAYLAVANKDWFSARGLHAELMDSTELSQLISASVTSVAEAAKGSAKQQGPNAEASIQLKALEDYVAELEIQGESIKLELADATLWLVLRHVAPQGEGSGKTAETKA
ncbi:hypothetical protein HJFPF1_06041 [Paramyrothecium foliicola]|nr:hypothetical protein HJFPF1_06041 [Paramyrothecium foliicola]